jgi:hypothetical protein
MRVTTIIAILIATGVSAAASADEPVGRYQMVSVGAGSAMIIDTTTGDLWRAWWPSALPGPSANPGGIAYMGKVSREAVSKPSEPSTSR